MRTSSLPTYVRPAALPVLLTREGDARDKDHEHDEHHHRADESQHDSGRPLRPLRHDSPTLDASMAPGPRP